MAASKAEMIRETWSMMNTNELTSIYSERRWNIAPGEHRHPNKRKITLVKRCSILALEIVRLPTGGGRVDDLRLPVWASPWLRRAWSPCCRNPHFDEYTEQSAFAPNTHYIFNMQFSRC